jgi:hypothetical protein
MIGKHLGYAQVVTPGEPDREYDVLTCGHTNKVIFVRPREDVYRCTCCGSYIHPSEVGKGCFPMERRLEQMEARARLFEATY